MMKYKGPGCYRFINEYGKVIYVGSAKNIDRRVHSHFSKSGHLPKEFYQSVTPWHTQVISALSITLSILDLYGVIYSFPTEFFLLFIYPNAIPVESISNLL